MRTRTSALVVALALTSLVAARPARAQNEAGFAPAATSGSGFGAPGQIVLSMGPTTDEHLFFHKSTGGGWTLQLSPALDYFLTSRVAVGGVLGYRHASGGAGSDSVTLGARASTNFDFNDKFGVWPLGGLFFNHTSADHTSSSNTWLGFYVPVLFHVAPHFFVGLGPSLEWNLQGKNDSVWGLDSVLGGWF